MPSISFLCSWAPRAGPLADPGARSGPRQYGRSPAAVRGAYGDSDKPLRDVDAGGRGDKDLREIRHIRYNEDKQA